MGFASGAGVPAIMVFLQGILSFFSPCVLPLVPLYIGYLAGGTKTVDADGTVHYKKRTVLINTLFFVIGISATFFILGVGFTAAGQFFTGNRMLFARIGGVIIILFGLVQLGVFNFDFLNREHRLPFNLDKLAMNPLLAFVLGFTFSFAWTPCVGPVLASVLLMASSSSSFASGFILIGVYTLGFVLPFLAVGLFTSTLLDFFKRHQKAVRYTVKAGGVLMIVMGIMMFTGWMNGITGYLSRAGAGSSAPQPSPTVTTEPVPSPTPENTPEESAKKTLAPDFTLTDQYGVTHTLSEYRGKTVFLNFFATWCGPCQKEMPDIETLYKKYGDNSGGLVVLSVANPHTEEGPNNNDMSPEKIAEFMSDNGFTYPALMDRTGAVFQTYGIRSFPTTFMIDKDGYVEGYVPGMLTSSMMESIVNQAMAQ
ncbi:AhpC/TSA family protein [Eubacterium limosum]|nr:AhpC/TSA family protein [Eubacterium limosum]